MVVGDVDGFREAVSLLLAAPGLQILGSYRCGDRAVQAVREQQPDVVILDFPDVPEWGLTLTRKFVAASPTTALLVLAAPNIPVDADQLVALGARGFLAKQTQRFLDAVRVIRHGGVYIGDEGMPQVSANSGDPDDERPYGLTQRELEVLRHVGAGLANKVIARDLSISEQAVKNHLSQIMRKLGVRNRTAAAVVAYRDGLAHDPAQTFR